MSLKAFAGLLVGTVLIFHPVVKSCIYHISASMLLPHNTHIENYSVVLIALIFIKLTQFFFEEQFSLTFWNLFSYVQ
jgi:hypothetical protein